MDEDQSTEKQPAPIMIRPRVRPRPQPAPEPTGPKLRGRDLHFAQMAALPPKRRVLSRQARKLAKLIAPIVGEGWGGRGRRKG